MLYENQCWRPLDVRVSLERGHLEANGRKETSHAEERHGKA